MVAVRLVAVDLDGTLVREDGAVDPRDLDALARARARGIRVVVVTGRLPAGALPLARALAPGKPSEPHQPVICADGALTLCAHTRERLDLRSLPAASLERLADVASAHRLVPLLLGDDRVYGRAEHRGHAEWLAGWTARFEAVAGHGAHGAPIVSAFGIGAATDVARACEAAAASGHEIDAFALGDAAEGLAALRLRPAGVDKGSALARLCTRLGIVAKEVVAIGDWLNDITMLTWAGQSFAMGHALPEVRRAARRCLTATAATGGGVAEALERAGIEAPR
jgi:Cof subfamily protein (haloacid dehalogenase superfamily)